MLHRRPPTLNVILGGMAEQFEFRDLSDAVFWGVDLQRATFRDVDLKGARISHARRADVTIDAEIDRLVINGVDVTAYVNEHDEWFALRSRLRPTDPDSMRQGWQAFLTAWRSAIERAQVFPRSSATRRSTGSGRSSGPSATSSSPPPTSGSPCRSSPAPSTRSASRTPGSADFGWPGVDAAADPTFEDAVAAWRDRSGQLHDHLDDIEPAALPSRWRFSRTARPPCTTA
jgi:hypothetical protein